MTRPRVRIRGSRGRRTAEADGETLPVLRSTFGNLAAGTCLAPADPASVTPRRHADLAAGLRRGDRAIMQKDADPHRMDRAGPIGVIRDQNLDIAADGSIRPNITARLADARK